MLESLELVGTMLFFLPSPLSMALHTISVISKTRTRFFCALTSADMVRSHWGQAVTIISAFKSISILRAATAETRSLSTISKSPPPPQQRAFSRFWAISTRIISGTASMTHRGGSWISVTPNLLVSFRF
jgi:hypothetical protein